MVTNVGSCMDLGMLANGVGYSEVELWLYIAFVQIVDDHSINETQAFYA